jgi:hypothetical protein
VTYATTSARRDTKARLLDISERCGGAPFWALGYPGPSVLGGMVLRTIRLGELRSSEVAVVGGVSHML